MSNSHIQNLLLARKLMRGIEDKQVDLENWQASNDVRVHKEPECGTIACFGGWIALSPMFPQVSVCPSSGMPIMPVSPVGPLWGGDVAFHLFGNSMLFAAKTSKEKKRRLTDKQAVLERIHDQIQRMRYEDDQS